MRDLEVTTTSNEIYRALIETDEHAKTDNKQLTKEKLKWRPGIESLAWICKTTRKFEKFPTKERY